MGNYRYKIFIPRRLATKSILIMKFITISNIFFIVPVVASFYMKEWMYFAIAVSAGIISFLYHYIDEYHHSNLSLYSSMRVLDWLIAFCGYMYMIYFIIEKVKISMQMPLFIALVATNLFFWYGFIYKGYKRLHPWFHVITPIVSAVVVLSK